MVSFADLAQLLDVERSWLSDELACIRSDAIRSRMLESPDFVTRMKQRLLGRMGITAGQLDALPADTRRAMAAFLSSPARTAGICGLAIHPRLALLSVEPAYAAALARAFKPADVVLALRTGKACGCTEDATAGFAPHSAASVAMDAGIACLQSWAESQPGPVAAFVGLALPKAKPAVLADTSRRALRIAVAGEVLKHLAESATPERLSA